MVVWTVLRAAGRPARAQRDGEAAWLRSAGGDDHRAPARAQPHAVAARRRAYPGRLRRHASGVGPCRRPSPSRRRGLRRARTRSACRSATRPAGRSRRSRAGGAARRSRRRRWRSAPAELGAGRLDDRDVRAVGRERRVKEVVGRVTGDVALTGETDVDRQQAEAVRERGVVAGVGAHQARAGPAGVDRPPRRRLAVAPIGVRDEEVGLEMEDRRAARDTPERDRPWRFARRSGRSRR